MHAGQEFELKVTPDRYLTVRYAGASGDFNPIHIDEEFARQVGLPGRILHGLWTMAQVARAHTEALGRPGQARAAVGPVPRDGHARAGDHGPRDRSHEVDDGRARVDSEAEQGGKRIIRNGEAEGLIEGAHRESEADRVTYIRCYTRDEVREILPRAGPNCAVQHRQTRRAARAPAGHRPAARSGDLRRLAPGLVRPAAEQRRPQPRAFEEVMGDLASPGPPQHPHG